MTNDHNTTTPHPGDITIPGIGTFSSEGVDAVLFYKVDRTGAVVWATKLQPTGTDAFSDVVDVKVDDKGFIWLTGNFAGVGGVLEIEGLPPLVSEGPGSYERTNYVIKFDASGQAISALPIYCTGWTGGCKCGGIACSVRACVVASPDLGTRLGRLPFPPPPGGPQETVAVSIMDLYSSFS